MKLDEPDPVLGRVLRTATFKEARGRPEVIASLDNKANNVDYLLRQARKAVTARTVGILSPSERDGDHLYDEDDDDDNPDDREIAQQHMTTADRLKHFFSPFTRLAPGMQSPREEHNHNHIYQPSGLQASHDFHPHPPGHDGFLQVGAEPQQPSPTQQAPGSPGSPALSQGHPPSNARALSSMSSMRARSKGLSVSIHASVIPTSSPTSPLGRVPDGRNLARSVSTGPGASRGNSRCASPTPSTTSGQAGEGRGYNPSVAMSRRRDSRAGDNPSPSPSPGATAPPSRGLNPALSSSIRSSVSNPGRGPLSLGDAGGSRGGLTSPVGGMSLRTRMGPHTAASSGGAAADEGTDWGAYAGVRARPSPPVHDGGVASAPIPHHLMSRRGKQRASDVFDDEELAELIAGRCSVGGSTKVVVTARGSLDTGSVVSLEALAAALPVGEEATGRWPRSEGKVSMQPPAVSRLRGTLSISTDFGNGSAAGSLDPSSPGSASDMQSQGGAASQPRSSRNNTRGRRLSITLDPSTLDPSMLPDANAINSTVGVAYRSPSQAELERATSGSGSSLQSFGSVPSPLSRQALGLSSPSTPSVGGSKLGLSCSRNAMSAAMLGGSILSRGGAAQADQGMGIVLVDGDGFDDEDHEEEGPGFSDEQTYLLDEAPAQESFSETHRALAQLRSMTHRERSGTAGVGRGIRTAGAGPGPGATVPEPRWNNGATAYRARRVNKDINYNAPLPFAEVDRASMFKKAKGAGLTRDMVPS